MLLRKTTGAYYLAVWAESSVWNAATRTDRSIASQRVELRLPTRSTLEVFDPARSSAAIGRSTSSSQRLDLSDGMLVVKIASPRNEIASPRNATTEENSSHADDPLTDRRSAVRAALIWTADSAVRQLRRSGSSQLRRRGMVRIAARATTPGRYTVRLDRKGVIAQGGRSFASTGTRRLVLRRSPRGARLLRPGSRRRLVLHVTFKDRAGRRLSVRRHVTAPR